MSLHINPNGKVLCTARICWLCAVLLIGDQHALAQGELWLKAGDADQDLDFDPFDIVRVLQADKYLTGQPATWGEGDWNCAPGGSLGNPPTGDGLFNHFDLIAAMIDDSGGYPFRMPGGSYMPSPEDLSGELQPFTDWVDDNVSIGYEAGNGRLWISPPKDKDLTSLLIIAPPHVIIGDRPRDLFDGNFDVFDSSVACGSDRPQCRPGFSVLFKAEFAERFGYLDFGDVAQPGISLDSLLDDWYVAGSLAGGGGLGDVNLVYVKDLLPGDANQDFAFDQLDIVQVLQAGKYLSGDAATWGEGDWDGGPGGYPGEPPPGNGLFDQKDILAALQAGAYVTGPYTVVGRKSAPPDAVPEPTSIVLLCFGGIVLTCRHLMRRRELSNGPH